MSTCQALHPDPEGAEAVEEEEEEGDYEDAEENEDENEMFEDADESNGGNNGVAPMEESWSDLRKSFFSFLFFELIPGTKENGLK